MIQAKSCQYTYWSDANYDNYFTHFLLSESTPNTSIVLSSSALGPISVAGYFPPGYAINNATVIHQYFTQRPALLSNFRNTLMRTKAMKDMQRKAELIVSYF